MGVFSLLASGIIGGVLAILFDRGVRRMLAPTIIKRKLVVGQMSISTQVSYEPPDSFGSYVYWCVPIKIKASGMWNLLVSSIEDVRAFVTFVRCNKRFQTLWINPYTDDSSLVSLRIGTEREIGVAKVSQGVVRPYCSDELTPADILRGDEDILIELKAGDSTLGCWLFRESIVAGSMQKVAPVKTL
jgi:hypothetical protein